MTLRPATWLDTAITVAAKSVLYNVSDMRQMWHGSMRLKKAIRTRYVAQSDDNSLTSY